MFPESLHVCALWAAARQPALAGCGVAAGAKPLAQTTFTSTLYWLPPGSRPALAAAGWELDGTDRLGDHLCALWAEVGFGRLLGDTVHSALRLRRHNSTPLFTFPCRNSLRL